MDYQQLLARIRSLSDSIRPMCDNGLTCQISPCATAEEVAAVETEINRELPSVLRDFFLNCSAKVDFDWYLDLEKLSDDLPDVLERVTFGAFTFDLSLAKSDWVNWTDWRDCIEHPERYAAGPFRYTYDQLFPVISIMNGDLIAVVTSGDDHGRIIYLDHEGGSLDQAVLAEDFDTFLDTWLSLCCPGPEGWLLEPFYDTDLRRLSATCGNAQIWRSLIGLA